MITPARLAEIELAIDCHANEALTAPAGELVAEVRRLARLVEDLREARDAVTTSARREEAEVSRLLARLEGESHLRIRLIEEHATELERARGPRPTLINDSLKEIAGHLERIAEAATNEEASALLFAIHRAGQSGRR